MSIRKYIAYLKTIETGSITHAAAQLGYTQSAISRMIADLEDAWGVKLLTRKPLRHRDQLGGFGASAQTPGHL